MGGPYIGTSGFMYRHWRGNFYPEKLPQSKWLVHYAERFPTVELNVTFYRLPDKNAFEKWRAETPGDFKFTLKGSRYITHIKRLLEPKEPLKRFMERATLLREKLGVVLWQLPPNFRKDPGRLEGFITALRPYGLRHAFEFREESWMDREVASLLEKEGHAICAADWPPFADKPPATAGFYYIRRHGHGGSYDTCYTEEELRRDARRIRKFLKGGMDVFIYFNNDAWGFAPQNALELKEILKK